MSITKVIMVGLDGADFGILDPLIADGELPFIQEILRNGARATLLSTQPMNTLPSWTSIFTGVNPGKHGLINFVFRDERADFAIARGKDRMVPTVWELLSKYNVKQIIVNDPISYPPSKINGIMLTGFLSPLASTNISYPPEIREELDRACGGYQSDLPFGFEQIIRKDREKGLQLITGLAKKDYEVTKYLAKNYDWDLLSITFTSTDRLQHFYFNDTSKIRSHYRMLDGMIKDICELAEKEANVFLMSDHGFCQLKKCFYVNSWLQSQNYVKKQRSLLNRVLSRFHLTGDKLSSILIQLHLYSLLDKIVPDRIKQQVPNNIEEYRTDYKTSPVVFPSTDNGLYFNDPSLIPKVRASLEALAASSEDSPIEKVLDRQEVFWGEFTNRAPEIPLLASYGFEISPRLAPTWLGPPSTIGDIRDGTHRPEGIFMAMGPNIVHKELASPLHGWDVAPTILQCFGVPIPGYIDGKVISQLFKTTDLISTTTYNEKLTTREYSEVITEEEEKEIENRFRALGYI